ncbi:hypothetical protein AMATHDRAFT_9132 [Amanita thiersii Skay4041]|uniref:Uncharacterized protein n=1 Tax=Amanita thiersii Skay4041 TaxID=703135 RepID=A0A2A9N6S4_9AGAR|nr:hypothetical protein AMATHDRAFT_9132 [Amanita thiersii Skay4041]
MFAALRKGGYILQNLLQEGSGGNGLNEAIGGRFQNQNLEVVVAVDGEGRHTSGFDRDFKVCKKSLVSARVTI